MATSSSIAMMALAPQKTRGFIFVVSIGSKRMAKLTVPQLGHNPATGMKKM